MLYAKFYNLEREPFSLSPDPEFIYLARSHREALAQLRYVVEQRRGFAVLTGEVGTGKTTLLRAILDSAGTRIRTAYVLNPPRSRAEMYMTLAAELGIDLKSGDAWMQDTYRFLLEANRKGETVVALFDEGQSIPTEVLEEVRLLTNLETSRTKLLQVILAGQPELDQALQLDQLRALRQRISVRVSLSPLNLEETTEYIATRVTLAGAHTIPFSPDAGRLIHQYSRGIPRLINLLCENSLIAGYASDQLMIDAAIVKLAAEEACIPAPADAPTEQVMNPISAGSQITADPGNPAPENAETSARDHAESDAARAPDPISSATMEASKAATAIPTTPVEPPLTSPPNSQPSSPKPHRVDGRISPAANAVSAPGLNVNEIVIAAAPARVELPLAAPPYSESPPFRPPSGLAKDAAPRLPSIPHSAASAENGTERRESINGDGGQLSARLDNPPTRAFRSRKTRPLSERMWILAASDRERNGFGYSAPKPSHTSILLSERPSFAPRSGAQTSRYLRLAVLVFCAIALAGSVLFASVAQSVPSIVSRVQSLVQEATQTLGSSPSSGSNESN